MPQVKNVPITKDVCLAARSIVKILMSWQTLSDLLDVFTWYFFCDEEWESDK